MLRHVFHTEVVTLRAALVDVPASGPITEEIRQAVISVNRYASPTDASFPSQRLELRLPPGPHLVRDVLRQLGELPAAA